MARVVDKRFAFGPGENEKFRSLMRMVERCGIHAAHRGLLLAKGEERAEWIEVGEGDATKEVKKVKRKGMDPEKARAEGERLRVEKRVAVAQRNRPAATAHSRGGGAPDQSGVASRRPSGYGPAGRYHS